MEYVSDDQHRKQWNNDSTAAQISRKKICDLAAPDDELGEGE
jgi:hypothetical protein